jgi:hypothetical protein
MSRRLVRPHTTSETPCTIKRFADADGDLQRQVLEEAAKFVAEVVAPLNAAGDDPGCRFNAEAVMTPPGFVQAYEAFWQAGWPALHALWSMAGKAFPRNENSRANKASAARNLNRASLSS